MGMVKNTMIGNLTDSWQLTKLSEYFHLGEFFKNFDKKPQGDVVDSIYSLVQLVLDPVRKKFGVTEITSGFRDSVVNQLIGGETNSQHLRGKGVDFVCVKAKMLDVYNYIVDVLKWPGECFLYKQRGHIHIGLPEFGVKSDKGILDK